MPTTANTELMGIARFTFHERTVEEFKRLSRQCMDIVRTQDSGTLEYVIHVNADESEAIVIERYRDTDALAQHLGNIGEELMAAISATADIRGELLGSPSSEFAASLEGSPVQLFRPFLSLEQVRG